MPNEDHSRVMEKTSQILYAAGLEGPNDAVIRREIYNALLEAEARGVESEVDHEGDIDFDRFLRKRRAAELRAQIHAESAV